tara:strand:+ start:971 stop:1132 length:162 start_codon:yes stop_codon:yes gene_type:complete
MNLNDDEAVDVIDAVRLHTQSLSKKGEKKSATRYQKLLETLIKRYEEITRTKK